MKYADYTVGVISMNSVFSGSGNPYIIRRSIKKAKEMDLDLLIAPEWGLMSRYSEKFRMAPRDAKKLIPSDEQKLINPAYIRLPYSPREARSLISILEKDSKGSDMIIMPGSMMIYTDSKHMYNTMPVISNGNIVYSVIKNYDGGSKSFSPDKYIGRKKAMFKLWPDSRNFNDFKKVSVFTQNGINFGVEVCADAGVLGKSTGKDSLDIQVLISAGSRWTDLTALKKSGYVIFCDGDPYKRTYGHVTVEECIYSPGPVSVGLKESKTFLDHEIVNNNLYVYHLDIKR